MGMRRRREVEFIEISHRFIVLESRLNNSKPAASWTNQSIRKTERRLYAFLRPIAMSCFQTRSLNLYPGIHHFHQPIAPGRYTPPRRGSPPCRPAPATYTQHTVRSIGQNGGCGMEADKVGQRYLAWVHPIAPQTTKCE